MKKFFKIIVITILFVLILYLIVSAIYTIKYIDFGNSPYRGLANTEGFDPKKNIVRQIMGLPKTYNADLSVPLFFLLPATVKLFRNNSFNLYKYFYN